MGNKNSNFTLCCDEQSIIFDNPLYSVKKDTDDICTLCNKKKNCVKILKCKHNMCEDCFNFNFYLKNNTDCPICHIKIV